MTTVCTKTVGPLGQLVYCNGLYSVDSTYELRLYRRPPVLTYRIMLNRRALREGKSLISRQYLDDDDWGERETMTHMIQPVQDAPTTS